MTKLEERVTTLEREMADVLRERDEIRALASGAHEDVGTTQAMLRAHIRSLASLRKTQNDHHAEMKREFAEVRQGMAEIRQDVTGVRQEMTEVRQEMREGLADVRTEMRDGFGKVDAGMAKLTELLTEAIKKD